MRDVEVRAVVHGYWQESKWPVSVPRLNDRCWVCSVCGEAQSYGKCDYCPNCGNPMDGDPGLSQPPGEA